MLLLSFWVPLSDLVIPNFHTDQIGTLFGGSLGTDLEKILVHVLPMTISLKSGDTTSRLAGV